MNRRSYPKKEKVNHNGGFIIMKRKTISLILVFIVVISVLVVSACADKKTGPGDIVRPPFTPSEGEGWPSSVLFNHFGLGDWSEPNGLEGIIYRAFTEESKELNTITIEDYLRIEFETGTGLSSALIRDYIQRAFPFIEIDEGIIAFRAIGWKWYSNSLVVIDVHFASSGYGIIDVIRNTSNDLRQGWPRANDLAIFDARDFTPSPGIENQFNFIASGNDRYRLFSLFNGATESFLTHFRNYFMPRATLIEDDGNWIAFRKIVGNIHYEYRGWWYEDGFSGFEFSRYTTDLPPGTGTGWPTSAMLNPFKLDDWVEPPGLQDLTWEAEAGYYGISLDIYFTSATEESVDAMRKYLSSKATGSLDHEWGGVYRGVFYAYDEEYLYNYEVYFSLSNGGTIWLRRNDLYEFDYSRSIKNERERNRNPFAPNRNRR